MTASIGGPGLALVRGPEPQRPIVLTSGNAARSLGHPPGLVALPHGLTLGAAAELSTALALAVAHYDVDRARAIANRIDAVLDAEAEGRRIPLGPGLARDWFETPVGARSTTRRRTS
ncbi:hypothetical protein LO772_29870 [Yinghuangia sp. ASG 101]|uniref:hypothetical protein n=1 Tax=Yinghuangia sp. ASG 101 TaxID=2896848 RepID=UPI001E2F7D5A|nr:hypothetical protein [Yinghuangia sp. ASG 101]UGQ10975.1 hypothetical protein LO772_29870 [Yinghuangia sp. ASG 101]